MWQLCIIPAKLLDVVDAVDLARRHRDLQPLPRGHPPVTSTSTSLSAPEAIATAGWRRRRPKKVRQAQSRFCLAGGPTLALNVVVYFSECT